MRKLKFKATFTTASGDFTENITVILISECLFFKSLSEKTKSSDTKQCELKMFDSPTARSVKPLLTLSSAGKPDVMETKPTSFNHVVSGAAATRSRPKVQEVEKGSWPTLPCPHPVVAPVTWRRRTCRLPAENILTAYSKRDIRHIHDPNRRFSSLTDKSLLIRSVTEDDSGTYWCNDGAAVELIVVSPDVPQVSPGLLLAIVSSVSLLFIIVITVSVVCFVRRRRLKQREAEDKCVVYEQIDEQLTFLSPQDASNQNEPIYHSIADRPLVVNKTDSSPPEESHYSLITAVPLGQNNEGTVDHQPTVWPRLLSQVSAGHRFFCSFCSFFDQRHVLSAAETKSRVMKICGCTSGVKRKKRVETCDTLRLELRAAAAAAGVTLVFHPNMFWFLVFAFVWFLQTVVTCCSRNSTVVHLSVPEHHHVHLPCGDPEASVVVWTDQNQSITAGRWGTYETNEDPKRFLLLPDGSLRLLWLDKSDSGEYRCNQQLVAELQVLTGSDFTVSVGRTLLLPCSSFSKSRVRWFLRRDRGERQLILTWFRNGTTKAEGDGRRLSFDNDTLQIQDLQPGDSGQYQCSGKAWTRFTVTVVQPEPTGFSRTTDPTQTPPVTETDEAEARRRRRKEKEKERRRRPERALLIVGVISLGLMIVLMAAVGILLSILRCRRKRKKHGAEGRE
ncbi:uncharacterized protein V6R79_002533 [Siganus canaliculatus]